MRKAEVMSGKVHIIFRYMILPPLAKKIKSTLYSLIIVTSTCQGENLKLTITDFLRATNLTQIIALKITLDYHAAESRSP